MGLSLMLMIVGHVVIHGQNFALPGGPTYNPVTSWVSDYAARWPEGLWIKAAIVCFCLAIAWFCDLAIRKLAKGRWMLVGRLFWLSVTGVMIGGVLLVILFDMLPDHYAEVPPGWFEKLIGKGSSYVPVPRTTEEWSMRWYHQLGFELFVGAYALAAIITLAVEVLRKTWGTLATSIFLLAAAAVFVIWLFSNTPLAGVPQRALLALIAFWLVRSTRFLQAKEPESTGLLPSEKIYSAELMQQPVFDNRLHKRYRAFIYGALALIALGFLSVVIKYGFIIFPAAALISFSAGVVIMFRKYKRDNHELLKSTGDETLFKAGHRGIKLVAFVFVALLPGITIHFILDRVIESKLTQSKASLDNSLSSTPSFFKDPEGWLRQKWLHESKEPTDWFFETLIETLRWLDRLFVAYLICIALWLWVRYTARIVIAQAGSVRFSLKDHS